MRKSQFELKQINGQPAERPTRKTLLRARRAGFLMAKNAKYINMLLDSHSIIKGQ